MKNSEGTYMWNKVVIKSVRDNLIHKGGVSHTLSPKLRFILKSFSSFSLTVSHKVSVLLL